jgi:hypothetical protein
MVLSSNTVTAMAGAGTEAQANWLEIDQLLSGIPTLAEIPEIVTRRWSS